MPALRITPRRTCSITASSGIDDRFIPLSGIRCALHLVSAAGRNVNGYLRAVSSINGKWPDRPAQSSRPGAHIKRQPSSSAHALHGCSSR